MRIRIVPSLLALSAVLLMTGCANFMAPRGDVAAQVDALVERKEYVRALDTLSYVNKEDEAYAAAQAKGNQIMELIESYEAELSLNVDGAIQKGDWKEVNRLLEEARRSIPGRPSLAAALERIAKASESERTRIAEARLVAEAQWLAQSIALDQDMALLAPGDFSVQWQLYNARIRAKELGEKTLLIGKAALEQEDLTKAKQFLDLSARLAPSEEMMKVNRQLDDRISRQQQQKEAQQRKLQEEKQAREYTALLDAIEQCLSQQELVRCQSLVDQAERYGYKDERLGSLRERMRSAVKSATKTRMDEGIALYRDGRFKEAIASWNKVLTLDAGNEEAVFNIIRAERVLEKLEKLRGKQAEK
ncbi:MAG: hypothetical protein AB1810_05880 [Pseudomonadota bacterium]